MVTGIPASGKTTLMMQLAYELRTDSHILIMSSPTKEEATLLINNLSGEKAVIFVDDFADDIEGLAVLQKNSNIQIVCFERDNKLESITHKISIKKLKIIDITDLSELDINKILEGIPRNMRFKEGRSIKMASYDRPSIFEVNQANLVSPTLKSRFTKIMLEYIQKDDIGTLDFILLSSYLDSCDSYMTLDICNIFYNIKVITESTMDFIHNMKEKAGKIISITDFDKDQDVFSPRSSIMSEVLFEAGLSLHSGTHMQRIFNRFHSAVSRTRIPKYSSFKRKAYSADIIEKVYPIATDGESFYLDIYNHVDNSPHVLQNLALYMHRKGKNKDAFRWIEEALKVSRGRIPSIRNSHAIILFNANIHVDQTDYTAKNALDKSMKILEDLYHEDSRRSYHVTIYADQALSYHKKYRDKKGEEYLLRSKSWLELELRDNNWNHNIKRLSRETAGYLSIQGIK